MTDPKPDFDPPPTPEPPTSAARRGRRYARLRLSMGRHPADLIRMIVAAAVVLACYFATRSSGVNPVETTIFAQLERLPGWTTRGWEVLAFFGSWPGIAVAAAVAVYLGRTRMGISLALSGTLAWMLALVIQWTSGPRAVQVDALDGLLRGPGPGGFLFPSTHAAVIAALATAAGPYLTRPTKVTSWVLVILTATGDIFSGSHLPLGVFAGAVLGWGTGTLFHVLLKAPGRGTSQLAVQLALERAGIKGAQITLVRRWFLHPLEYKIVTVDGERLQLKIVRRMHRRAGPAYTIRRALASLEVEHDPGLSTPRHEVAHEAYVTLLAERAGVGTLPVLLAGEIAHGPPYLIRRSLEGRPLSTCDADFVSDTTLDEIWSNMRALDAAHITHHDLQAKNVFIDTDGHPHLVDFTLSRVGGPAEQRNQDAAEMLVSLTSVVGVDRAVTSAVRCMPTRTLEAALPYLQWLALHRQLRKQLTGRNATLLELREALADLIGAPPPTFRAPLRPTTLVMLVGGGIAVYLLLPQLSSTVSVVHSFGKGDWRWLLATAVLGLLGVAASGLSIIGSSPARLPFGKTMAVQLGAAFTGRTTAAGIGFYTINVAFMERLGRRRSQAVAVVALNRVAMGFVSAIATVIGILLIGTVVPIHDINIPHSWQLIVSVGVILAAVIAFLVSPYGRRRIWRPLMGHARVMLGELSAALRRPLRAAQLFGGCLAYLVVSAFSLATALAAFTPHVPLGPVLAVYVVGSVLGNMVPTPGGLGAVEGALIAGLTAIGISPTTAIAAALASRLLSFWLPVAPGIAAYRLLQHYGTI